MRIIIYTDPEMNCDTYIMIVYMTLLYLQYLTFVPYNSFLRYLAPPPPKKKPFDNAMCFVGPYLFSLNYSRGRALIPPTYLSYCGVL